MARVLAHPIRFQILIDLSWDILYVDQEGWEAFALKFQRHLEDLLAESVVIKERLKENPDAPRILITYMMATFENRERIR